jgi:hypothetical protein
MTFRRDRVPSVPNLPNGSETVTSDQGKTFRKFRGVYKTSELRNIPRNPEGTLSPKGLPDEEAGRKRDARAPTPAPGRAALANPAHAISFQWSDPS